jgi:phospholipid/cholesterol/gamma-HCH transport system permease protein
MNIFEAIGSVVLKRLEYVGGLSLQFGAAVRATPRVLPFAGRRGRWGASLKQMNAIGVSALPMVATVAACGGGILAIQCAMALHRYGAIQLVVGIVAVAFTRELGPLLTAIVVSGRSGSAFSAEIGTMVVTEEIDALQTMAIDPVELVVAPKYAAALVVVPCLTIMSNLFGILAGGVFMALSGQMEFRTYLRYAVDAIVLKDVFSGLFKSVVFASIIVHVGCREGFLVKGGPEAVGNSATAAVVRSTFYVIFADLFITSMFYALGM